MAVPAAKAPSLEFFKGMTQLSGTTRFSLDIVHQPATGDAQVAAAPPSVALEKGNPTTLTGWAVDLPGHRNADAVYVLLDEKLVTSCNIAIARPDVATALGDQIFTMSGFSCAIPGKRVVAGRHKVTLAIVAQGGRTYYAVAPPTAFVVR